MADDIKPGRPLKFKSVDELQQKIDEYFGDCDPHISTHKVKRMKAEDSKFYWADEQYLTEQKPYTVHGLAVALDTTRETLLDYESGDHDSNETNGPDGQSFSDTIKKAKGRIAEYVEQQLFKTQAAGPIFSLKNNFGWRDRSEVDHTTKDQPIPLLAGIAPENFEVDNGSAETDNSADQNQPAS